jgi:hypothetical protein
MEIQPLSREIYQMAKEIQIKSFTLHFEGGSDQGYLYVACDYDSSTVDARKISDFQQEVEEWAYGQNGVYDYNGAGEGNAYGDDIYYDLESGECSHNEWYMVRADGDSSSCELSIEEYCNEEDEEEWVD